MITPKECWIKCNSKCNKSFCMKLFKLDYLFNQALFSIPQRKRINLRIDEDGTDKEAFKQLKNIEEHIEEFVEEGKNLYLHSKNCGVGKTSWALRHGQAFLNKIWHKSELTCRLLFINVSRFLLALKDNISQKNEYAEHIKENVLKADLVIWDEIGVKAATEFEHEHLLNLINTRIDYGKSNIYTSNLDSEELREKLGERLYSRIINSSIEFEFFGQDKRGIEG